MLFLLCNINSIYYCQGISLWVVTLITWLRWCVTNFSTVKLHFPPPFPHCPLWKEVTTCSSHSKSGALCSTMRLFGIFMHRRFFYSVPCIYLVNHSCMLVWSHGYLLYIVNYSPLLHSLFVARLAPDLATGISFGWFLCPYDLPPSLCACVVLVQYFLTYWYNQMLQAYLTYSLP